MVPKKKKNSPEVTTKKINKNFSQKKKKKNPFAFSPKHKKIPRKHQNWIYKYLGGNKFLCNKTFETLKSKQKKKAHNGERNGGVTNHGSPKGIDV